MGHLAKAIEQAVTEPAMRQRAAELAERIRAEDGVGQAVRIICRYMDELNGVEDGRSGRVGL